MVKKKYLILVNALLWAAAGINILRIGVRAALDDGTRVWLWGILVFTLFALMFFRVIGKNVKRIHAMEGEKAPLYKFLTLKGYLIIAFMMTLGIVLRHIGSIPNAFFAFFYTGLGSALTLAGLLGGLKRPTQN
ncbi:MAG: hypothetical protein MJZ86_09740 [Bacteroidales bacterium]|nr:hypothetical protein [Bacteroidales bacterium]